ncbi:hypothetical protein [Allorhizocola rhizosphaerae]|uniref:hypothetical protein n=1 Tax=Allorhizocola rhizosphaerae TaxID=1872709 RepID=UPI0013C361D0|nr:hypothetical protein [Allorhizocola rhizosphaerae]
MSGVVGDGVMEVSGSLDRQDLPDPSAAGTATEFVDALRRLKNWSGAGFRRLENVLPKSGRCCRGARSRRR